MSSHKMFAVACRCDFWHEQAMLGSCATHCHVVQGTGLMLYQRLRKASRNGRDLFGCKFRGQLTFSPQVSSRAKCNALRSVWMQCVVQGLGGTAAYQGTECRASNCQRMRRRVRATRLIGSSSRLETCTNPTDKDRESSPRTIQRSQNSHA